LSPDPYQKAELDEAENHNEQLETLQNIFLLWLRECHCEIRSINENEREVIKIPETLEVFFSGRHDICDLVYCK
jgi:hypothetical protein